MKTLTKIITIIVILVVNNACYSNSSKEILWNEECPSAVSDNAQERQALKKEIPDFEKGFRPLLDLQVVQKISEPNENLQKEMALTEKILKEVFKPGIIPLESIKDKFMLSNVNISSVEESKEQGLVFSVKQDKYIIQFLKRLHTICVTIRPTSGQTIEIPQLAEDIFNKRILPLKWEANFYLKELKRDSKILKAGQWSPRDYVRMTPSGEVYRVQFTGKVEWLPLGEGLYSLVNFYTNGKFAVFAISGGPRPLQKDVPGYPGSAGVGSAENEDGNVGK
ncbi:MAG: hypothetical protein A2173_10975 [Planctomycetes bacterium RBG_13_44_8b]|nr:MAG: hypothetical protein A2173_10975 [Planctomycetes bacterium RBG_13_44_8b]